jgi:hypothetical protein
MTMRSVLFMLLVLAPSACSRKTSEPVKSARGLTVIGTVQASTDSAGLATPGSFGVIGDAVAACTTATDPAPERTWCVLNDKPVFVSNSIGVDGTVMLTCKGEKQDASLACSATVSQ